MGTRKPYGREPWSFEALAVAVAQNYSIAGVLRQLGTTVSGNSYRWVHRLIDKYSPSHMVGERLERLTAMGQVLRDGDRYRLGANRTALFIARAVDAWRTVLGMPTVP